VKVANLADVKNDLSRFVALVRRGGRVRILVRGVPADLVPVQGPAESEAGDELEIAELETMGLSAVPPSRLPKPRLVSWSGQVRASRARARPK
jgi:antitoxin (DNA-binding transcriptional repressor) of toxin-antitoxin stability system